MELNIFTKEQQEFIKNNYNEFDRADFLSRKISSANTTNELPINELKDAMKLYRDRILKDREPFIAYNTIYNSKKEEVLQKHGYESSDFYDTETMEELNQIQNKMREEAEALESDMITPKKEKSALESMFKEDSVTNENTYKSRFK